MSAVALKPRWVEVAVDSTGPGGGQMYTYHLPDALADIAPGEAVLVEYGRRNALGVVLALAEGEPERETKPVIARVRSDGPLMPELQLRLAAHIARHYLAPAALVVRAMLAPDALERLERVTVQAANGPASEWRLRQRDDHRRLERLARLGRVEPSGRLGTRQLALLAELRDAAEPLSVTELGQRHGYGALRSLVKQGAVVLETREVARHPLAERPAPVRGAMPEGGELSPAQATVVDRIRSLIAGGEHGVILIDGPTAGGKTAVYAEALRAALSESRGGLVLVPEIALALPLLERLAHDLPVEVAVLHSALSEGERADEWRRIRSGEARIVVGTRLAVLAPLADPGVIIVDEEHDASYKSDRTPRYQARDVALELGRLAGVPVILGSATPDVASVGRARSGEFERFVLPERIAGAPPKVEIVDLRAELAAGNKGLYRSRWLKRWVRLIGRPATAPSWSSIDAAALRSSFAATAATSRSAPSASGRSSSMPRRWRYVATTAAPTAPVARRCPACDSPRIRYLGGGTERVEREVRLRFPEMRVDRLDRDVVERRGGAARVVDAFTNGELDVLVGTSLAAKGLDVPQVTLVGRRVGRHRAQPAGRARSRANVSAAGAGSRPGGPGRATWSGAHPDVSARASGDSRGGRRCG